ncbi:hypothetical protein [Vibrio cholerae]|uniref:hypothetical protein n=1 Tax=Vibrio cholerae TaxID=666 RepID=UPI001FAE85AB|nr:hypothetical protein [Vibrio cholerae]
MGALAITMKEQEKQEASKTRESLHDRKKRINTQHQIATGEIPYAQRIFNSWDLETINTIEIETSEGRFLVDKKLNDVISGEYLIDINGRLSLNHIQRLQKN